MSQSDKPFLFREPINPSNTFFEADYVEDCGPFALSGLDVTLPHILIHAHHH